MYFIQEELKEEEESILREVVESSLDIRSVSPITKNRAVSL